MLKLYSFNYSIPMYTFILLVATFGNTARAELMSVQQLKSLIELGEQGQLAATSYVQGLVDGILGMESLHNKELKTPLEFCKLHESYNSGQPVKHPAFDTAFMISEWEKKKQPMNALAVDMVLTYLTFKYSC